MVSAQLRRSAIFPVGVLIALVYLTVLQRLRSAQFGAHSSLSTSTSSSLLYSKYTTVPPTSCTQPIRLVGKSTTPTSLAQFLRQFPLSEPPKDVCFIFVPKVPRASYSVFHSVPRLFIHPGPLYSATLFATNNASRVIAANDDTLFFTTHYGTGKDDFVDAARSFATLLPTTTNLETRYAPIARDKLHVIDAAALLHDRSPAAAAAPLSAIFGQPLPPFHALQPASSKAVASAPYAILLGTQAPPSHNLLPPPRGVEISLPNSTHPNVRAVLFTANDAIPAVSAPVVVSDVAFFALFPAPARRGGRAIAGLVARTILRWAGHSIAVVSPALDVLTASDEADEDDVIVVDSSYERTPLGLATELDHIVGVLAAVTPQPLQDGMLDVTKCTKILLNSLASAGHILRTDVRLALRFMKTLRPKKLPMAKPEQTRFPDTAVCVTGQLRSAPFTAKSMLEDLHTATGGAFDVFLVAERDDRSIAAKLFRPVSMKYSVGREYHGKWIERVQRAEVIHETMSTNRQLRNYLWQLADMRDCLTLVQREETSRGVKYDFLARARPDTLLMQDMTRKLWGREFVAHGKRHAYYAMNDRFFVGGREKMGRLMACHDVFVWLIETGRVIHRRSGNAVHIMFKKEINSERFLARCAALKQVPLLGVAEIDARRVAYSNGVPRWREFDL